MGKNKVVFSKESVLYVKNTEQCYAYFFKKFPRGLSMHANKLPVLHRPVQKRTIQICNLPTCSTNPKQRYYSAQLVSAANGYKSYMYTIFSSRTLRLKMSFLKVVVLRVELNHFIWNKKKSWKRLF